jgi:hypothetical protein
MGAMVRGVNCNVGMLTYRLIKLYAIANCIFLDLGLCGALGLSI